MSYLLCNECGGYYKLQEGESPEDFDFCQCGGLLNLASADEILFRKYSIKCPGCGEISDGQPFCPFCGTILDTRESSRFNKDFHFHEVEAKSPKTFFAGKKIKTTDPGDWFLRDRLRVDTDGNYFREEVPSMFDKGREGGPGLNHLWEPGFLIQDIASGSDNKVIRFLKLKSPVEFGFLIYFLPWLAIYGLMGDAVFQLSVLLMLIASTTTSFILNKRNFSNVLVDVNLLAGLSIFAIILLIFLFIRYSFFNPLPVETPGSELTNTRLILIFLLNIVTANIGGFLGVLIRKNYNRSRF